MFQLTKKRTLTLATLGLAGLMSVGVIAAQANPGPTLLAPTSISSSTPAATNLPNTPDDSDGRVGSGHGIDDQADDSMSNDVNDAPDDSDGRVDSNSGPGNAVTIDDSSTSGRGSNSGHDDSDTSNSGSDTSSDDNSGSDDSGHDGSDDSGHGSAHE
ncbi:hypothetical protein E3O25_02945 [Cryobacterium sp. TMT1-3]|uniref:hypothetical protein n=1 Tax=Cryobacterium sp. TMT1-3 TaxID=1259237 RepID=UPI00106BD944|nr:hypothetical protein [Cryobacterium sp. TMT1-3]TFC30650.1 hypothetical protein E3O25_02945 [Cryobacterium sp. TMT1-3]